MRNLSHTRGQFFVYNLALLLPLLLIRCSTPETYEVVLHDMYIVGVNEGEPSGRGWIGINNGKIAAFGNLISDDNLPQGEESIDLSGTYLYPGLIDAHGHLFGYAELLNTVNLVGATSKEECIERIQAYKDAHPNDEWIIGRGWDQNDWPVKAFPTAADLAQFGDVNLYMTRIDGHAAWVNGRVLDAFGITNETKIDGGSIIDGVLVDNAETLVTLPKKTNRFWRAALLRAQDSLTKYGLVGMTDAGLNRKQILLLDSLHTEGSLQLIINAMISNNEEDLAYFEANGPIEKPLLLVKSVKAYLDGALGSRGALLRAPYHDLPAHYGLPLLSPESLDQLRDRCLENEWQLCVHAIGDSAHHVLLQSFNELPREGDLRFRVEHAQIMTPEDSAYYAHPNIVASVQPTHATSDMYWAEERLGPHRIEHAYSYKRLFNSSSAVAFGTDFPIEHIDPLATFFAATQRQDAVGWPEGGFLPQQKVSPEMALKAMTERAAYSAFGEGDYGSIRIGNQANFTVLNINLLKPSSSQRTDTKVLRTIASGNVMYSADE